MKTETKLGATRQPLSTSERFLDWDDARDLTPVLEKVRPFTMVPTESLVDLARVVRAVVTYGIPGQLVECGVWRGGSSFLMAELLRQAGVSDRKVWLFDSYEGLPAPKEIDGAKAFEYTQNTDSPWYHDNCAAALEQVQQAAAALGLNPHTEFIKGWFDQTLVPNGERIGPIAVLRIDADWYDSVRCCLESLYDQVVEGGFVIFDDYYTFDGCAIAVHEFLGKRGLSHQIENVIGRWEGAEYCQSALFRKGGGTWRWLDQYYRTTQDLASVIPAGETLILADDGVLGSELAIGRRAHSFIERDGQYWGPPPDGATAVRELERLRAAGANFIAFGWPALWWLDHYPELRQHLETTARRLLANGRLVVFDLRASAR
jgi:hypothetical protein